MTEVLPSLNRGSSANNVLLQTQQQQDPPQTASSFNPYDALGALMDEITRTLERAIKEREAVGGNMERALLNFSRRDEAISAELAGLPGDLDAYLRLVRDKKRLEARKQRLIAQSQVSHALNFHMGAEGLGPSLMDEVRAEEEELDRKAAEDAEAEMREEDAMSGMLDDAARGGRRKKKGRGGGNRAAPREDPAEVEAYLRYNDREGLFALLEEASVREREIEMQIESYPPGSREQLEAMTELGRTRAAQSEEVADFMHQYNPVRVPRNKEESLRALGLGHLPAPADIVADVERKYGREKKQRDRRPPKDGSGDSGGAGGGGDGDGYGGGGGGGGMGGGWDSHLGVDKDLEEEPVLPAVPLAAGEGSMILAGSESAPALLGRPSAEQPPRRDLEISSAVPDGAMSDAQRALLASTGVSLPSASIGSSSGSTATNSQHAGVVRGPNGTLLRVPGVGVSQAMSDRVVHDRLNSRAILDLPAYGSHQAGEEPKVSGADSEGPGHGAAGSRIGGGSGDAAAAAAHEDIRGIVKDNTEDMDLNFPTLEFRRRREFKDAEYYQKDFRPAPYPVSQSEGAVWSTMAREKRRMEKEQEYAGDYYEGDGGSFSERPMPTRTTGGAARKKAGKKKKGKKGKKSGGSAKSLEGDGAGLDDDERALREAEAEAAAAEAAGGNLDEAGASGKSSDIEVALMDARAALAASVERDQKEEGEAEEKGGSS